ncbi:MAG: alpha/beta fold hydrolase [Rhodobacteraceae bacterium]|nr:alpha/beta fold hydrolase [Paracoccaceae bacterium]
MSFLQPLALAVLAGSGAILTAAHLKTRRLARQAGQAVPQVGQIQPVPGGAIHYVELGDPDAPPVVLIHGLAGQLQHFTYAMAEDLARDFHVIALDRPGCGYSRRDDAALADPSAQARMIWEFLDAKLIEAPILVGHSLGGAVSLAMALDRPAHARALALIAPLTHPVGSTAESFLGLRIYRQWVRHLLAQTLAIPMAERTADTVLRQVFDPEPWPDNFLTDAGAALGLRPQAFIAASEDLVAAEAAMPDQSIAYGTIGLPPGAILTGAADAVLNPAEQADPMTEFGLPVTHLPDRGHMLPITVPQTCTGFVRDVAGQVT